MDPHHVDHDHDDAPAADHPATHHPADDHLDDAADDRDLHDPCDDVVDLDDEHLGAGDHHPDDIAADDRRADHLAALHVAAHDGADDDGPADDDHDRPADHHHDGAAVDPARRMISARRARTSTPNGSAARRVRRDRGAVLTETALTIPLFFLIVFGIIEGGLLFRDRLTTTSAAHDAARAATVSGDELSADRHVLDVMQDSSAPLPDGIIERIVVFKASGPGATVPTACLTGGVVGVCNSYTEADLAVDAGSFGCQADKDLDRYWCPSDRNVIQSAANGGPPDYIGVHFVIRRSSVSGIIPITELSSTKVLRIEPRDR